MKMIRLLHVRQNAGHLAVTLKKPTTRLSDRLDAIAVNLPTYYTNVSIDGIYSLVCPFFQKLARHKFL